jgi:hypothetical protein
MLASAKALVGAWAYEVGRHRGAPLVPHPQHRGNQEKPNDEVEIVMQAEADESRPRGHQADAGSQL